MASSPAKVFLHNLSNSDGSALYTSPNSTHTLQSALHYPLEVPHRSDEIPTDTFIEITLRPHNGVAMVKEKHIEQIVQRVLKSVVVGEQTPRCMLQVTIQVMEVEADEHLSGGIKSGGQGEGYLDLLVGAVNASILSCLDGGVRIRGSAGAVLVGIGENGETKISPSVRDRKRCTSLHALGFNWTGQCILMESEGDFEMEQWELAEETARTNICGGAAHTNGNQDDVEMDSVSASTQSLFELMKRSLLEKDARDKRWKP